MSVGNVASSALNPLMLLLPIRFLLCAILTHYTYIYYKEAEIKTILYLHHYKKKRTYSMLWKSKPLYEQIIGKILWLNLRELPTRIHLPRLNRSCRRRCTFIFAHKCEKTKKKRRYMKVSNVPKQAAYYVYCFYLSHSFLVLI